MTSQPLLLFFDKMKKKKVSKKTVKLHSQLFSFIVVCVLCLSERDKKQKPMTKGNVIHPPPPPLPRASLSMVDSSIITEHKICCCW